MLTAAMRSRVDALWDRFWSGGIANPLTAIEREEQTEISDIRFQQREPPQVMCAVPGHDAQPGIEEVVRFVEQAPIVHRHRLHGFGGLVLQRTTVFTMQHERQRAAAEEVSVDFEFGEGITELADGGAGRVVHEHLFRSRFGRDVVDHRHALVEEVPPACLQSPPHAIVRDALPFQTGNEFTRDGVEIREQVREGLARWLLHRQHLDPLAADHEVIAVAVDGRIGDEVIEMRVVRQGRCRHRRRVVVHKLAEEGERLVLRQPLRAKVAQLHVERLGLVVQRGDGAIEVCLKQRECVAC